jgi:hypothetical protein
MTTPAQKSIDVAAIRERVASFRKSATDNEAVSGIKDPADQGTVTPKTDPQGEAPKTGAPVKPGDAKSGGNGMPEGGDLKPEGVGDAETPSTTSGDAVDEAVKNPDTPVNKLATTQDKIASIRARMAGMQGQKPEGEKAASAQEDGGKPDDENKSANTDSSIPETVTDEVRLKLANAILATEQGVAFAQQILEQDMAREKAASLITAASEENFARLQKEASLAAEYEEEFLKQAALEEEAEFVQEVLAQRFDELTKDASEEEMAKIAHMRDVYATTLDGLETDMEKAAFMQGAADDAALQEAMAAGEELPADEISIEEIAQMVEEAVASGQLSEEEAAAILQGLQEEGMPEEMKAASTNLEILKKAEAEAGE